jgi:hypothetical protein
MLQQTATMAAHARAAPARVEWAGHCLELDEAAPALSGWRVALAAAIVGAVPVLLAFPVLAVLDPTLAAHTAGLLGGLAAGVTVMTGVRALVLVVAVVLVARSDARR